MADTKPDSKADPVSRASTTSSRPSGTPPAAAARFRVPGRQPSRPDQSESPRPPELDRRRSSMLSFSSLDDVTQAFADDIINPSTARGSKNEEDQVTHWHSTPLAFAILPAVGGLLFKNGSAFVTDVLLLGLAAIFMNWSIRLPWDWYYSAQEQHRQSEPDYFSGQQLDGAETAIESASEADGTPVQTPAAAWPRGGDAGERESAAAELRRQELLALAATFTFPVLAAYLLHLIRAQLSSSSTSLVSDYNLSIFLLAAEIRPFRQLVRLISKRTLHLQRTVMGLDDPFGSAVEEKNMVGSLTSRLADLETRLGDKTVVPASAPLAHKADVSDLSAELRRRYEPRLEGLERAVRRYEKRTTTLALLTDQRLAQLEARLHDALSLAAVAAQHSRRRGPLAHLADAAAACALWPFAALATLAAAPFRALDDVYTRLRALLFGSASSGAPPTPKRASSQRNPGAAGKGVKNGVDIGSRKAPPR